MYAKLMSRITESSLMEEDIVVRYCFLMFLAISDPKGYAIGTDVAIARRMNMPVPDFRRCVEELMKDDADSNSKEYGGKRIISSDGERGYFVVNYAKYRDTRDEENRRDYMREYMRKYRDSKDVSTVKSCKLSKPQLAKADGEEEEEVKEEVKTTTTPVTMSDDEFEKGLLIDSQPIKTPIPLLNLPRAAKPAKSRFLKPSIEEAKEYGRHIEMSGLQVSAWYDHFEANGWRVGGKTPMVDWRAAMRNGKRMASNFTTNGKSQQDLEVLMQIGSPTPRKRSDNFGSGLL